VAAAVARARDVRERSAHASIAVLVRRRKLIPWLVRDLLAAGLDASQEGGNPLTDTPAASAFVSLLHLADQPSDTAAWLHVSSTPWARALGVSEGAYSSDAGAARRASLAVREGLARDGAAGLLARLLRRCADQTDAESLRRLEQLSQLLDRAEASGPRSPGELVRYIRETPVEAPSAARVRVMTIHQSKGLEFDAVILPELHGLWKSGRGPIVSRSGERGPVVAVSLPGNEDLRRLHAPLARMYDEQRAREVGGELCVLYVALTRARHALEMIVPPGGSSGAASCSGARLLREALAPGVEATAGATLWRHERSDPAWTTEVEAPASAGPAPIEVDPRGLTGVGVEISAGALAPPPSAHERADGPEPVLPAGSRRRGTAGHRLMERVEWLDRAAPDEADAVAALVALGLGPVERSEMLARWRGWIEDAQVIATLSHGPCLGRLAALASAPGQGLRLSLRREWMFATGDRDGRIVRGQMDRIVIARDEAGDVRAAEIIDYKTDLAPAGEDEALYRGWRDGRVATYRGQMDAYRRAASRALKLAPERIGVRLLMLGARAGERAVDV
jgi:ATP-dependent exoDNAse (exonuclease V) beta subunit